MMKKLLIIGAIIVICLVGGYLFLLHYFTMPTQSEKLKEIIGKKVEVTGIVKPIHGFVLQAICTKCFGVGEPYEIETNGKCCYWFDYFNWNPYYVGDIMNKTVKMEAIVNKTQECPSTIQLPCDRLYLKPIKIEILK